MSEKMKIVGGIVAVCTFIVVVLVFMFGLGKNDDQNWQIKQSISGKVTIIDNPGWYLKLGATVWTWPRSVQRYFSKSEEEGGSKDESIRVTFNDGGTADISTMIRFQTPITEEFRRKAHRDYSGSVDNMTHSVRAHLINCAKATAPLMSASEHQSARKAEFTQIINDQLIKGLYQMRKVEKELKDRFDDKGKPVTVFATEIVLDENGLPIIAQKSPLEEYGIAVLQFSVTGTEYDPQTRNQFAAKKEAFLAAEKSKAQREQEVQQRLMIIEKGLREKAEVEVIANKEKAKAVIEAQKEKEVAELQAAKKVAVAEQEKLEADQKKLKAEVEAAQKLEVAKLEKAAAAENAEAIRLLAAAEEERIQKAGALTEEKEKLAILQKERDALVAAELSKIKVPGVIIGGGNGNGNGHNGSDTLGALINLMLLKSNGLLESGNIGTFKATEISNKQTQK